MKIFKDNEILYDVVTFIFSVAVTILCLIFIKNEADSILIGLVTQCIFMLYSNKIKQTFLANVAGYPIGAARILHILKHIEKVSEEGTRWERACIDTFISRFCIEIDSVDAKTLTMTPKEFMDFSNVLFKSLKKGDELFATSLYGGGKYWGEIYGKKYTSLNRIAADQGANITRVYISKNQSQTSDLQKLYFDTGTYATGFLAIQADIAALDQSAVKDFLMVNDELVCIFNFTSDMELIDSVTVMFRSNRIHPYKNYKDLILGVSTQMKGL